MHSHSATCYKYTDTKREKERETTISHIKLMTILNKWMQWGDMKWVQWGLYSYSVYKRLNI